MKKMAMQFLAIMLAFAIVMPVMAYSADEPQMADPCDGPQYAAEEPAGQIDFDVEWDRYRDGVWYFNMTLIIEGLGELLIDEETGEAIVVNHMGDSFSFMIDGVDGFIEDGIVWLHPDIFFEFVSPLIFVHYLPPRVERLDLTIWNEENFADVRGIFHTTDLPHGEIATYYIRFMSENLPARSPFSYPELDAAIWIVEELLAMGHDFANIEVQEFTYWDLFEYHDIWVWWDRVEWPDMIGEGREELIRVDRVSQNVVLTLPGQSERVIIVGAHYDTLAYPGASDNASGTALLLESAFRMLSLDHYYTIVYVFFGAEEVGLIGAHYFYSSLSEAERANIVMMVNADVLIEGPYLVYGAGSMPVIDDDELLEDIRERLIEELVEMVNRWHEEWLEQMEQMQDDVFIEDEYVRIINEYDIIEGEYVIFEYEIEIFIYDDFIPEDVTAEDFYWIHDLPASSILAWALEIGLIEFGMNEYALMVSNIAAELNAQNEFELISILESITLPSDQLVFLNAGHTVVMLAGFERVENLEYPGWFILRDEFTLTVLHSPQDEFYYIEARWPGMIQSNMRAFGLLLEGILTLGL